MIVCACNLLLTEVNEMLLHGHTDAYILYFRIKKYDYQYDGCHDNVSPYIDCAPDLDRNGRDELLSHDALRFDLLYVRVYVNVCTCQRVGVLTCVTPQRSNEFARLYVRTGVAREKPFPAPRWWRV